MRAPLAEALGTFWIVFVVAGLTAEGLVAPGLGAGAAAGVAYLAASLTLGQITIGHFNPALTLGLRAAGGFGGSLTFTILAQIVGASIALLLVGPPPVPAEPIAPFGAMLMLVPLIGMSVVLHVSGMYLRAEAVAYANAVALIGAVALAPGGYAGLSAAHATAAWLTGDGAPIGLWRIWLATAVGVALASWVWSVLRPVPVVRAGALAEGDEDEYEDDLTAVEDDDADEDDDETSRTARPRVAGRSRAVSAKATRPKTAARATAGNATEDADELEDSVTRAARTLTADALIEAGWTPPAQQKGRVRKNTPLRKPAR